MQRSLLFLKRALPVSFAAISGFHTFTAHADELKIDASVALPPNYNLAQHFDHTNLHIRAAPSDIVKLCNEAREYNFAAVCIQPCYVALCKELLRGTDVEICTVVGFPNGYSVTAVKAFETKVAIQQGADEIDVVINLCHVQAGDWKAIQSELEQIVAICKPAGVCVKVIIEAMVLSDAEIRKACECCVNAKVDYVKTSTGFNGKASYEQVKIMRSSVPAGMKVKAAGGIKTVEQARKYVELGSDRLGASSSVKIMKELATKCNMN